MDGTGSGVCRMNEVCARVKRMTTPRQKLVITLID